MQKIQIISFCLEVLVLFATSSSCIPNARLIDVNDPGRPTRPMPFSNPLAANSASIVNVAASVSTKSPSSTPIPSSTSVHLSTSISKSRSTTSTTIPPSFTVDSFTPSLIPNTASLPWMRSAVDFSTSLFSSTDLPFPPIPYIPTPTQNSFRSQMTALPPFPPQLSQFPPFPMIPDMLQMDPFTTMTDLPQLFPSNPLFPSSTFSTVLPTSSLQSASTSVITLPPGMPSSTYSTLSVSSATTIYTTLPSSPTLVNPTVTSFVTVAPAMTFSTIPTPLPFNQGSNVIVTPQQENMDSVFTTTIISDNRNEVPNLRLGRGRKVITTIVD